MNSDRKIGKIVSVNTYSAIVELGQEALSFVKNSFEGTHKVGIINSYIIIPIGADKIVGMVNSVQMVEESELNYKSSATLVLPKSRRTMKVTMIGSIVIDKNKKSKFEYGISGYPALENEVWSITETDLDIIFRKTEKNKTNLFEIGQSTIFPDYPVMLDMDNFFGKHAAVLGNTGSGKSCTVTAIIRSILEKEPKMKNAHFIIFDTNNEYERAFTLFEGEEISKILFDRIVIRDGFNLPHWTMNWQDYEAMFTPVGQIQAPVLANAIGRAKGSDVTIFQSLHLFDTLNRAVNRIREMLPKTTGHPLNDIRAQALAITSFDFTLQIEATTEIYTEFDFDKYNISFQRIHATILPANIQWQVITTQDSAITSVLTEITNYINEDVLRITELINRGSEGITNVDTPKPFSFTEFRNRHLIDEILEQERTTPRVRADMSSLLIRIDRFFRDPRYRFLFGVEPFDNAFSSFLRYIFGEEPSKNFTDDQPPWKDEYEDQSILFSFKKGEAKRHNITIIDFSNIASDVLENTTALVGRLIFEFVQRIKNRGSFPAVLVLEEAHHYIPEHTQNQRQIRARQVFERIAKEGRKFGLSLLIASQRPSELSRTVLAQCNSFIVHRIQNPEDQLYFRSVVSSISHDLLNQLPALPQRTALVLGDCVTAPIQVTIREISPKPDSKDPKFSEVWTDDDFTPPDFESIIEQWESGN